MRRIDRFHNACIRPTLRAAALLLCAASLLQSQPFPQRGRARLHRSLYEFRLDGNGNGAWWWSKDTAALPAASLVRSDGFLFSAEQEVASFFGGCWLGAQGWEAGPMIPGQPIPAVSHAGRFSENEWLALAEDERDAILQDMTAWPVSLGAPWRDANGNGIYDPIVGAFPSFPGDAPMPLGDEALWTVTRDGGEFAERRWGQRSAGLEFRHLAWAMAGEGCPERVVIQRLRVINKAAGFLKEMRLGLYADVALGDPSDDVVGVDTTLGLAYIWNAGDADPVLGNPPAVGYLLLQGIMERADGERGLFDLQLREGIRNQAPHAFTYFSHGGAYQSVPDPDSSLLPQQLRAALRGLRADGSVQRDPASGETTRFAAAGNPVRRTGWVDGMHAAAGGRVLLLSFGPFALAQGDTQEVVIARIGAQGDASITDVQALIDYSLCVQQHYTSQFITTVPPLHTPADLAITGAWPQPLPAEARALFLRINARQATDISVRWTDLLGRVLGESRHAIVEGSSVLAIPNAGGIGLVPALSGPGVRVIELIAGRTRAERIIVLE